MKRTTSEALLSDAFAAMVRSPGGAAGLPELPTLLPEFTARQGVADFVAVQCTAQQLGHAAEAGWGTLLRQPATAAVYSHTRWAPRSFAYLCTRTGLAPRTVKGSLCALESGGLLKQTERGTFLRAQHLHPQPDVWAFEIKVSNWRRALFQALQYQAFAHRVCVVIAAEFAHRAEKHRELFMRLGVGLLVLHHSSGKPSLTRKVAPRRRRPSFGEYHLHALGQIIELGTGQERHSRATRSAPIPHGSSPLGPGIGASPPARLNSSAPGDGGARPSQASSGEGEGASGVTVGSPVSVSIASGSPARRRAVGRTRSATASRPA